MRSKRRGLKLLAIVLGLSLVAAACGNDDDDAAPGTTAPSEETPDPDDEETVDNPCLADNGTANGNDDDDDAAEGALGVTGQAAGGAGAATVFAQDIDDPTIDISAEAGEGDVVFAVNQLFSGLLHLSATHNAAQAAWHIGATHFRGAVYAEPDGTIVRNADLIDSITLVSEDPQVVEYVINADATWSDGEPITGDDFAFMWQAQSDPEGISEPASTAGYEDISDIEVSDDGKTFTVTFDRPFADWQVLFDYVYPEHYLASVCNGDALASFRFGFDIETLPIGDQPMVSGGPFVLSDFRPGESFILERNDEYWADLAGPARIIGTFITDDTQLPSALGNDEFDVSYPQGQLDLVQQFENLPNAEFEVGFGTFWEHIDFNLDNEFLSDDAVRQAIAHGIDRNDIVETILEPISPEAQILNNRIYFPFQEDYVDNAGPYGERDVDAAVQVLADAGYESGDVTLRLAWVDPNPRRGATVEVIQQQLAEVGITIELDPKPDFSFLGEGDFDIALFGWTGGLALGTRTTPLYTTGEGQNFAGYSNPEVDGLLADAALELDAAVRADLYNQVDTILWEDLPTIPLFQNPDLLVWRPAAVSGPTYNGFMGPTWNMAGWSVL